LINTPLSPPRPSIIYQLETQRDRERRGERESPAFPFRTEIIHDFHGKPKNKEARGIQKKSNSRRKQRR